MVFERLRSILSDQFNIDEDSINYDTDFFKDLNADSLDIIDLVSTISGEFGMEIDDAKIEGFKTVGDVVDYVENRLKN